MTSGIPFALVFCIGFWTTVIFMARYVFLQSTAEVSGLYLGVAVLLAALLLVPGEG